MCLCVGDQEMNTRLIKKKSVQDERSGLSKIFLHTLISTKYKIHMCEGGQRNYYMCLQDTK